MKGYTKKPCHGCGEVPQDYQGRPTEGVCGSCKKLLTFAKDTKQAIVNAGDALVVYRLPWRDYSLPYLRHTKSAFSKDETPSSDVFKQNFIDLIRLLVKPKDLNSHFNNDELLIDGQRDSEGTGFLNPAVRDRLNNIYQSTIQMLDEAYEKGCKDGHSLLVGLANGKVSIDVFNKATSGVEK